LDTFFTVVPKALTTLSKHQGCPSYRSRTINTHNYTADHSARGRGKWSGGGNLHRHPKLRLIPSTQRMDEEGRGRGMGEPLLYNLFVNVAPRRQSWMGPST
jgi:hypothetical protein